MAFYQRGDRMTLLDHDTGETLDWTVIDVFFLGKHRMVALLHVEKPTNPIVQLLEHPKDGLLQTVTDPILLHAAIARFKERRGGK